MATSYTPTVRTVDTSDWAEWERESILAPYALDGAPYGESIPTRWFPTLEAAMTEAVSLVAAVQGTTYGTSWGDATAWHESIRVTYYVDPSVTPEPESHTPEYGTACALCHTAGFPPITAPAPRGEDGEIDPLVFPSPYTAPVSAREATRGTEWEMELIGAPAVPASGNAVAGIISDWLTDPVYAGTTRTPEGFYRTAMGEEITRYARTGN